MHACVHVCVRMHAISGYECVMCVFVCEILTLINVVIKTLTYNNGSQTQVNQIVLRKTQPKGIKKSIDKSG